MDEARILLLDVLQLLVGGVGHPLFVVSGHANQVRHNLRNKDCILLFPPSIQSWKLGSDLIKHRRLKIVNRDCRGKFDLPEQDGQDPVPGSVESPSERRAAPEKECSTDSLDVPTAT